MRKNNKRFIKRIVLGLGSGFFVMTAIARLKHGDSVFLNEPEQRNPMEGKRVLFIENESEPENADGVRGHLEAVGDAEITETIYLKHVKRGLDILLSFAGLIVLMPVLTAISIAIVIDDPGPVLFTQKRVGKNKQYFKLHKFRSMKMSTPHDVPTHMLTNPEQYITKVGKFLRAHSLDELPQVWDIFIGNMSVIGPRPALWNQDMLTANREIHGANEIKPGLTGWAQINGRDALELADKAKYDGEYAERIHQRGITPFLFDFKCFCGTVFSVLRRDGVVEGGTGAMRNILRPGVPEEDPTTPFGCDLELKVDSEAEKKVLITGAGSYIGESIIKYAENKYPNIKIESIDMIDGSWRAFDFSGYDCVYHVAGIAHADVGKVSDDIKEKYYTVNTDLAIETALKAKKEGVKQFIFMSSMIVYGESAPYGEKKLIDRFTRPEPANFYGDSKWQADKGVRSLADSRFKVAVLRPPMIYGRGSKGNYPILAKMAKKLPVFPEVDNQRSMLYIENLCEFVCNLILCGEGGLFFPQNEEYVCTSEMVETIAKITGNRVLVNKVFNLPVKASLHLNGKVRDLANKAFGNLTYDQKLSRYSFGYIVEGLAGSIAKTEKSDDSKARVQYKKLNDLHGKRVLLIALPGYSDGIVKQMQEMGAEVDYINDKPNDGFICKTLGRLQIKSYQTVINRYYEKKLSALTDRDYDFVLVLRGEYTPSGTLKLIRTMYPHAKLILYMWDGLHKSNTRGIEKKWDQYDQIYTFDRIDYEANKGILDFLPLFYYNSYLPDESIVDSFEYDLSFIGTGHGDRIKIVKTIMNNCKNEGMKSYVYFFVPHFFVFVINKLFNKNFDDVTIKDVHFKALPFNKLYDIYSKSRCIVDVESVGQHGLTMRSIEVLGLKRKFITTNKDITHYDFYHPDNIFVLDRKNPVVDLDFLKKPYYEMPENMYEKYSLKNWILEVLK